MVTREYEHERDRGSIHISVDSNHGVDSSVDTRCFTGETLVLNKRGLEKKVTAISKMRNYSRRTNEAKAEAKNIASPKHLDDYKVALKTLRC